MTLRALAAMAAILGAADSGRSHAVHADSTGAGEKAAVAGAARGRAVAWEMSIDGFLSEWGGAHRIALQPTADYVGVRGVFSGWPEHEGDVCVQWDADNLYIAAAVSDDSLDADHIPPEKKEWRGAGGPKDRMFYYDHLKVFVRGPDEDTGFNLWVSPLPAAGGAFAWGGRQRSSPEQELPIQAATQVRAGVYSYELALPWQWLEIHPVPGMVLDAMFLLTDCDRPGSSVGAKVGGDSAKWIWWRHKIQLQGNPPGLKPPPPPEPEPPASPLQRPVVVPTADLAKNRVGDAIARLKSREDSMREASAASQGRERSLARSTSDSGSSRAAARVVEAATASAQPATASAQPATAITAAALKRIGARNRALLAKPAIIELPSWVSDLERPKKLTQDQADSLVVGLVRTFARLTSGDIGGRTDTFVNDGARAVRAERVTVRRFLVLLSQRALREIAAGGALRPRIEAAARTAGIETAAGERLVQTVLSGARKVYDEEYKTTTTRELVKRGRKKAKLDHREAAAFLKSLVSVGW